MENNELYIHFNSKITVEPSNEDDFYIVTFTVLNKELMYKCHKDSITWLITKITERIAVMKWLTKTYTSNS